MDEDLPPGKLHSLLVEASKLGETADVDRTVRSASAAEAAWRRATSDDAFAAAPEAVRAHSLNSLALAHMRRFWLTGDMQQGAAALEAARRSVAEASCDAEVRRTVARNASLLAAELQQATMQPEYLDIAIQFAREACSCDTSDSKDSAESLRALATALFRRFEVAGDRKALDEAIGHLRSGLKMVSPNSQLAAEYSTNLGAFLLKQAPLDPGLLDEAVGLQSHALELVWGRDPYLHASIGSNLAEALATRGDLQESEEDRTRSLDLLRSLAQLPGAPEEVLLTCAVNLGSGLMREYLRDGDNAFLNEAMERFERLTAATSHHPAAEVRTHFARMLSEAYHTSGRIELLDRSIYLLRLAATNASNEDPASAEVCHSLAIVLHDRFNLTDAYPDLEEAEQAIQRAINVAKQRKRSYSALLSTASHIFASRHAIRPDARGRKKVMTAAREAVRLSMSETRSFQANARTSTAAILLKIGVHESSGDLIAEADKMAAVPLEYVDAARRFRLLSLRAKIKKERAALIASEEAVQSAIDAHRTAACMALPGDAKSLHSLAASWAMWAFQRCSWAEAAEATRIAVDACDSVLGQQHDQESYSEWTERTTELREAHAYALARCGDLWGAIGEVEKARFQAISAPTVLADSVGAVTSAAPSLDADSVKAKLDRGEALVYWITLELGAAALVVANTGSATTHHEVLWFDGYQGDMSQSLLIGTPEKPGWLPTYAVWREDYFSDAGLAQIHEFLSLLLAEYSGLGFANITSCLKRLGVTKAIYSLGPVLSLLPMEAMPLGDGRTLMDAHQTSFIPCAALLRHELSKLPLPVSTAVSIFEDSRADLSFASIETEILAETFANHNSYPRSAVSLSDIPSLLTGVQIWHFACHGWVDNAAPLQSRLRAAADGDLTLEAVLSMLPTEPRIAILAACETGLAGLSRLHAGMSLGSGFLLAGSGAVITSLWAVPDWCVALFVARFCHAIAISGATPVSAFQEAQSWLRDTDWTTKISFLRDNPGRSIWHDLADLLQRLPSRPTLSFPFYWAAFRILGR